MPREIRKRGKKHKKTVQGDVQTALAEEISHPEPSWIVPSQKSPEGVNSDAPFGFVEPDVKAYFKTVDQTLRQWQELAPQYQADSDDDPNEERRLFLIAALSEMSGKEKQLATDPESSNVLERMTYSMDDFVKRVFMDRLAGSFEQLARHRFGSHVVQTLFDVAKGTIAREQKGIFPPLPESSEDEGHLPTLTQLVIDACNEILPSTSSLIMDPFASHILRAVFVLLCPPLAAESEDGTSHRKSRTTLRSKKSAAHKAKQGPMKSVLMNSTPQLDLRTVPPEFDDMAKNFLDRVRTNLGENETRALAADKVACPVLLILLHLEAHHEMSNQPDSLMDRVSVGMITACLKSPVEPPEASDYLTTLLREPISSHLLETLVSTVPPAAFNLLWDGYFRGKLGRLAAHPVANFVVARATERLSAEQLLSAIEELAGSWAKMIKSARTGVLRVLIDRAAAVNSGEKEVVEAIHIGFNLADVKDRNMLVNSVLFLKSLVRKSLFSTHSGINDANKEHPVSIGENTTATSLDVVPSHPHRGNARRQLAPSHAEPTTQGAVLLQSLLKLSEPHNQPVIDSIMSLTTPDILTLCHHTTSSRVIDSLLDSPSVPARSKRKFILSLIGHYHSLVDDRIGSRVGDRCWAWADPYLKEKIARSLIPQEQFLAASFYGKFFARNLHLHLLKRQPDEWKAMQSKSTDSTQIDPQNMQHWGGSKHNDAVEAADATADQSKKPGKRKRDAKPADEIDVLFTAALGKKQKKGQLTSTSVHKIHPTEDSKESADTKQGKRQGVKVDLAVVLGAIRAAPREPVESAGKRGH